MIERKTVMQKLTTKPVEFKVLTPLLDFLISDAFLLSAEVRETALIASLSENKAALIFVIIEYHADEV